MREAKARGARTYGIVNVVGSTIARESDGGIYVHAGPEIESLRRRRSRVRWLLCSSSRSSWQGCAISPWSMERRSSRRWWRCPRRFKHPGSRRGDGNHRRGIQERQNFLYLGRGYSFPTALEGALKLKEISYIHAEGYPAAEMKHGPIALIDENMPVLFITPHDSVFDKVVSNVQEVKARGGG